MSESCQDDSDERCEGPGLSLILLFTFISVTLFLLSSFAYDYIKKSADLGLEDEGIEMAKHEIVNERDIDLLKLYLTVFKRRGRFKRATDVANKYYNSASNFNHLYYTKDELVMNILGTSELAVFLYDCIDNSLANRTVTYIEDHIAVFSVLKMLRIDAVFDIIQCIWSLFSRYVDLPKDILLLYIIWIQLVNSDTGSFSISIFWACASSVLASEILHLMTIMTYRDLTNYSAARRIGTYITFPVMPAFFIVRVLKLKLMKNRLLDKLDVENQSLHQMRYYYIEEIDNEVKQIQLFISRICCNENVLENMTHLSILCIIILESFSYSSSVEAIYSLFMKKTRWLTYTLAVITFMSILKGQLNFLKANKNGCLSLKGTIILTPFFIIGTISRL